MDLTNASAIVTGGAGGFADELVFFKIVMFLRAGCSWDTFDEMCRDSGLSGRTCRRRFAQWRDDAQIAHLDAMFVRSRGGGNDLVGLTRHGKGQRCRSRVTSNRFRCSSS
jgi:hypothetical protein